MTRVSPVLTIGHVDIAFKNDLVSRDTHASGKDIDELGDNLIDSGPAFLGRAFKHLNVLVR